MRALLFAVAAWFALVGAAQADDFMLLGVGSPTGSGIGPFTPPSFTPFPAAYFPPDNPLVSGIVNYGLKTNGGTLGGPLEVPTTTNNSWFMYVEGTTDDNLSWTTSPQAETALAGNASQFGCTSSVCAGGNDRYLSVSSAISPTAAAFALRVLRVSIPWWQGESVTGITNTSGTGWSNSGGNFTWTGTGGGCLREPSGYVQVVAGGTIVTNAGVKVVDPGFGCTSAPTLIVNNTTVPGVGVGTGVTVALTIGSSTGIQTKPRQHWCGVIGQYGQDNAGTSSTWTGTVASTTLTLTSNATGTFAIGEQIAGTNNVYIVSLATGTLGQSGSTYTLSATYSPSGTQHSYFGNQFAAFVDQNGSPLSGSPAIVSYSNLGSTAINASFFNTTQATIGDMFNMLGTSVTTTGASEHGWGGALGPVGMQWGAFPNAVTAGTPDSAPLVNLCTKAVEPLAYFSANYTVRGFYRLNDAGTWADDSTSIVSAGNGNAGTAWAAASPIVSGFPLAGAPNAGGSALTLTDNGAGTTFPVTNYAAGTGSIKLNGTYNTSTLGGTPANIQAQISATPGGSAITGCGGTCSWANVSSQMLAGGNWSGTVTGVPAGGPYFVSVRPSNATAYVVDGDRIFVGLAVGWIGQSQQYIMISSATTPNQGSGSTATYPSGQHQALAGSLDIGSAGLYATLPSMKIDGWALGHAGVRELTTASFPPASTSLLGDGIETYLDALALLSGGWPVQVTNLARSGNPVDIWADGYTAQGPTNLTNTSGTFSATLAFSESSLGISPTPIANSVGNTILADTLVIKDSTGAVVASDTSTVTYGTSSASLTGSTVTGGTVNYLTGSLSGLTFSPTPMNLPLTASWTNIVDLQPAATGVQTVWYDGLDNTGNGSPSTGWISSVMARAPGGFSVMGLEQCSANINEFANYSAGAVSMTAKWSYVLGTKFPEDFPSYSLSTPVISFGFPRDNSPLSAPPFNSAGTAGGCSQWTHDLGTAGSAYHYTGAGAYGYGGSYPDDNLLGGINSVDNPHENSGVYGGQRLGRRMAANTWDFLSGSTNATEPTLASSAFDNTSTYNAACASTPYRCIDFTFTLSASQATSLATCGTNIAGGTYPATGVCSVTTANGTLIEGFRIGSGSATESGGSLYDDGLDIYNVAFSQSGAFTCNIVAATVVQCVKISGSWTSGSTYASYGDNFAINRGGSLWGNVGGVGLTVSAGGTLYTPTNGVSTKSMTGGGCTVEPSISFTMSLGVITSAYPATPGYGCSSTPTVVYPSGGSGGAITIAGNIGSSQASANEADMNKAGELLYDNAAVSTSSALHSIYYGGGSASPSNPCPLAGYCEPGNPVTPFGLITLVAVTG